MEPFRELAGKIRDEAELLERRGMEAQASMARSYAQEIETAIRDYWHEELKVAEAARENGCSETKMRSLIDEGVVPASSRQPTQVLRADLPCYRGQSPDLREATTDELAGDALLHAAGGA